jgi:fibronectin-binding autotransporter adhesin
LSLNGAGFDTGSGTLGALTTTGGGTTTYAGPITVASNATINAGGGTLNLTGGIVKHATVLTFTGGGTIVVTDNGIVGNLPNSDLIVSETTLLVQTANSYLGPTYIRNGGTLESNAANALPSSPARSALILDDSGSGSSTLALTGGFNQTAASLTGSGTSTVNLNNNKLTVGADSGSTTFHGTIEGSGGSLEKDGESTLILTGANTHTGGTTVSAGTLRVNNSTGSGTGSGAVSVTSGATLGGTGSIQGDTTIGTGATHAPGALSTVGEQHFSGDLTYAAGSIFEWDLTASGENMAGMAFDMVGADGDIVVDQNNSVFKIVFGEGVDMSEQFWKPSYVTPTWAMTSIFHKAFISDSAFSTVQTSIDVSQYGSFSINSTTLQWNAVPEPTSALAGLLLAAGLLRRRR